MKYIPSIAFKEMSGSAKGVTAAKMKNRKYIRNRGYGGFVRTQDQAKVKGIFKRLTTMWKTLTNENILAWNKLALSQQGRSVLGTVAKISGSNLFTRLNYWIVACDGQPEVTPPTLLGVENPSSATIVCEGETFTFKLDQALADNGGIYLVIEATEGQSNGVSRAHSKAVAIKMVEEPTAVAVALGTPEHIIAYNTYQVKNYDRFELASFSEPAKQQWRDLHWEADLQKAFDAGRRMAGY